MEKVVTKEQLTEANELINISDTGIMALSLGENSNWGDNYQMAMAIRMRRTLHSLDDTIKVLKKSMTISSWAMGFMTLIILILTGLLVWRV